MNSLLKKSWAIAVLCVVLLAVAAFAGYRLYLSANTVILWGGFRVPKSQLILARVDVTNGTTFHAYEIHDHQLVLQIARDVSKMQKVNQITPTNFPPAQNYSPIAKFTIVTQKYGTCGGSFWSIEPSGATIWQDSNGYYWNVPKNLLDTLTKDIQAPSTTKLF